MKLTIRSSLADVAVAIGDSLRRAGIRGVLTGGACAHLYTLGAYVSVDVDFVLSATPRATELDLALSTLGFTRDGDRYVHPTIPFFVEFPRGPLGVGEDFDIVPVWKSRGGSRTLALSATDSCRDRLAAYYHWNDRMSLDVAVSIALKNAVALSKIREWSRNEGYEERYDTFLAELRRAKRAERTRGAKRSDDKR